MKIVILTAVNKIKKSITSLFPNFWLKRHLDHKEEPVLLY